MKANNSAEIRNDLHGPLIGVPEWVFNRSMPDHWLEKVVALCLEWSTRTIHSVPLQNQPLDEAQLLAVGLAMRDADLLGYLGHDIRSAWCVVPWPEGVKQIRQEVCWTLSEWKRIERNRKDGTVDLFDIYDPTRAHYKAWAAERSAKSDRVNGFDDDARVSEAFAALQGQISSERKEHDATRILESASFYIAANQARGG